MRGLLARKHIKEGKASTEILRRYRVWDEVDGAARGWGAKGRRGSQERHTQFGNQALSLSDSRPCDSIWAIDWTTALNFKRSDGGRSSGVYFVQLPGGQLVVVKPDDEVSAARAAVATTPPPSAPPAAPPAGGGRLLRLPARVLLRRRPPRHARRRHRLGRGRRNQGGARAARPGQAALAAQLVESAERALCPASGPRPPFSLSCFPGSSEGSADDWDPHFQRPGSVRRRRSPRCSVACPPYS